MADIAHPAGLVAAGLHPSPVSYADFVTTTTHKTLRGPRGGMVMCRERYAKDLDRTVLPGIQGGPLMHVIAAKAVAFREAQTPEWRSYQGQIVKNAKALAAAMLTHGYRLVSGGTDTHLLLVDLTPKGITGKEAQEALDRAWITVNKNGIPFDTKGPMVTSGIRIGTPAVTTRGMGEAEMAEIAAFIDRVLTSLGNASVEASVRADVQALTSRFPLYQERLRGSARSAATPRTAWSIRAWAARASSSGGGASASAATGATPPTSTLRTCCPMWSSATGDASRSTGRSSEAPSSSPARSGRWVCKRWTTWWPTSRSSSTSARRRRSPASSSARW